MKQLLIIAVFLFSCTTGKIKDVAVESGSNTSSNESEGGGVIKDSSGCELNGDPIADAYIGRIQDFFLIFLVLYPKYILNIQLIEILPRISIMPIQWTLYILFLFQIVL